MTVAKVVSVFAASSESVDKKYKEGAYRLGQLIAEEGWIQVNGGGDTGLMAACTRGGLDTGGIVDCVILDRFVTDSLSKGFRNVQITKTMADRKAGLSEKADAFIALPGGFGTLDELAEVMCMRQLSCHEKPIVLLNTSGYYESLINFVREGIRLRFMAEEVGQAIGFANTPQDALQFINNYSPVKIDKDTINSGEMAAASKHEQKE